MASQSNFAAQVAPMSHVERVAVQEAEHSFLRQQAVQQLAAQNISKDAGQVQRMEAGVNGQKVRHRDKRQDSGRKRHFFEGENASGPEEAVLDAVFEDAGNNNVWAGNILNIKV